MLTTRIPRSQGRKLWYRDNAQPKKDTADAHTYH